jgi:hypothetical protein
MRDPVRVGVIQSNYIPWRGYFDFIASVDRFVIYDDVAYSTGSWRNRNKLKTVDGTKWITVPVKKKLGLAIDETQIEYRHPWLEQHRGLLKASLGRCPFYDDARALWEEGVSGEPETISELNVKLIRLIASYLGITTPIELSRPYAIPGAKNEKLIGLLGTVGATTYVSGAAAKDYLDPSLYRERGIRLEFKSYAYAPYPQQFGEFESAVSILDLIANTGPESPRYLRSLEENEVAVA